MATVFEEAGVGNNVVESVELLGRRVEPEDVVITVCIAGTSGVGNLNAVVGGAFPVGVFELLEVDALIGEHEGQANEVIRGE